MALDEFILRKFMSRNFIYSVSRRGSFIFKKRTEDIGFYYDFNKY